MLLGFSGRKQSGKDTCARFVAANAHIFWEQGSMPITTEFVYVGGPMKGFALEFGVPYESVWGTDEEKNMPIHIKWGQLPHFCRLYAQLAVAKGFEVADRWYYDHINKQMTGRQLLQQIGEEMFLPMDPLYWVKKYEAAVAASKAQLKLTPDPRKPEQIHAIKRLGGYTFRLLRSPYSDSHESEVALDPERFDQTAFHAVIDNRHLTVTQTNRRVLKWLRHLGLVQGRIDLARVDWEPK